MRIDFKIWESIIFSLAVIFFSDLAFSDSRQSSSSIFKAIESGDLEKAKALLVSSGINVQDV